MNKTTPALPNRLVKTLFMIGIMASAFSSSPSLAAGKPQKPADNIVLGRCHMGGCWWWKVEKTEDIPAPKDQAIKNQGRLVKVYQKVVSLDIPNGKYPNRFPKNKSKLWDNEKVKESYVFCTKKLHTFIEYDTELQKLVGTVIFIGKNGFTYGVTEGILNLYLHICHADKPLVLDYPESEALVGDVTLKQPTDIFYLSEQDIKKLNSQL